MDYREIQGKNAGKKTAKNVSDRRTDQIHRLAQKPMDAAQAAGKAAKQDRETPQGKLRSCLLRKLHGKRARK